MTEPADFKVKAMMDQQRRSAVQVYRDLVYGKQPWWRICLAELVMLLIGGMPGALGLLLRSKAYPLFFKRTGRKVIFGRNLTLRHTHKIELGDGVILDDNVVLDAKGESNHGIRLGDHVYVGRNTIIYCKNGNITLGDKVNLSSNCQLFSSNDMTFGQGVIVGAFSYFLSGGEYDLEDPTPFASQSGMCTRGPLLIGNNVWIAAHVSVLDGAGVGDNSVIGAGAVVNKTIPENSVAVGLPARVVSERSSSRPQS